MSVIIEFSEHSMVKIELLKNHGLEISKSMIEDIIRFPDKMEKSYKDRFIAQKGLDDEHVIRIVYETIREKIRVITLYPGRRIRYEKD